LPISSPSSLTIRVLASRMDSYFMSTTIWVVCTFCGKIEKRRVSSRIFPTLSSFKRLAACRSLFVLVTSMENTASSGATWTSAVPETVITGSLSISCADKEKAEHSSITIKMVDRFISKSSTFKYSLVRQDVLRVHDLHLLIIQDDFVFEFSN